MKNELMVVENIEKRLRMRREPVIFPLTPTHRKELRELKNRNVGDLRNRLSVIKKLKLDEFKKNNYDKISKNLQGCKKISEDLNSDWESRIEKIRLVLSERKEFEKKFDTKYLDLNNDYGDIAQLKIENDFKRKFKFDEDNVVRKIADEMFEKKYSISFEQVSKQIDDVCTKYEEAINFGDLEIVKELYYIMKSADKFFDKVANLKV
jgi:hypothetical protein